MPSDVPRLSLVVPTLNEAQGIEDFLRRLLGVVEPLGGVCITVVDDHSEDGTAELAEAVLGERGRVLVRHGPRSLSASVIEGWRSPGHVLGVMDADLSHPPEQVPQLLAEIEEGGADVALATRYMPGGGTEGWPLRRRIASQVARGLARTLVHARDPLSGFMFLRREVIDGVTLDPRGWKIALEVLARGRYQRLAEVPYVFRDRHYGRSKFGPHAVVDYLHHAVRLRLHLAARGIVRR